MKILWVDTETTGLDKDKCDIIQLAGIVIINGEEKERFNLFMQPVNYENIQAEALEKTNKTVEQLKSYPTPQESFIKFKEILSKYVDKYDKKDKFYMAGHNVKFDQEFIKSLFEKQGDRFFGSWFTYHVIDLMYFATILHTGGIINFPSFTLQSIAETLRLPIDNQLHDAAIDIDLTRNCFCELYGRYINYES